LQNIKDIKVGASMLHFEVYSLLLYASRV